VAHDPIGTHPPFTAKPAQFVVHLGAAASRHSAQAASGQSRGVVPHRRSARELPDLVDGVVALVEHRFKSGSHVDQLGGGHQVGR
jgi:hypothetical protein